MADVNGTVLTKHFTDPTTGDGAVLKTIQDNVTLAHTLKVQATGVTFNGTLDPTNLALEAGNLAELVTIRGALAPTLGAVQKVAVSTVAASTGSAIGTALVSVVSTTNCHIVIADAPTATANSFYLPANTPMLFKCATTNKISAIRDTADGSLYVTAVS